MTDEEWRASVVEHAVFRGKQDPRDLEDVKAHGRVSRPCVPSGGTVPLVSDTVPLAGLLRHVEAHYSEDQLRNDLDCVLVLCGSESDRGEVRRFARAKLSGRSYKAPTGAVSVSGVSCAQCGRRFAAARSTARFCSPGCRVKHGRRNVA